MKRSAAIKQLAQLLPEILNEYKYSEEYTDYTPYKALEWLADDILNKIENHDIMVPPLARFWLRNKNGKLLYSSSNGEHLNFWEAESE